MGVGGIGLSAVSVVQHYNADEIYDIAGIGSYVGGAIYVGVSVGYDVIVLNKTVAETARSQDTVTIDGWQIAIGIGIGINWVHEGNSYTFLRPIKERGITIPETMRQWEDTKPDHGFFEM